MTTAAATTIDPDDIARFSKIAAEWWSPTGKFKPLHRLNPVRIKYIRDTLCQVFGRDTQDVRPLDGLRLVDIGCGGGLLAEPMARLGADVVGIDAADRNIKTASVHAREVGIAIDYRATSAEALAATEERFDVVLAMEIVEHVADVPLFLNSLATLLKPGGVLFMATLNRTAKSFAMAIIGAEYVLRWLPRGTHDWRQFPKPSELANGLRQAGVSVQDVTGVTYNPLFDSFSLNPRDLGVNYMLWGRKDG